MPDPTLLVASGIAFAISAISWFSERRKQREHEAWCEGKSQTAGVVSRIGERGHLSRNKPTSDDDVQHVPVVRFKAANGVEYEFDAPGVSAKSGDSHTVAYDPALPSSARVLSRSPRPGCAYAMIAAALILICLAFLR